MAPPPLPVKPIAVRPLRRAARSARRIFGERPEVDIAISTSPSRPSPRTWRSNRLLESVIVADSGHHRTVGGQRHRGDRRPVVIEPRQELAGDVLCVGGAAAIAGQQQLMPEASASATRSTIAAIVAMNSGSAIAASTASRDRTR